MPELRVLRPSPGRPDAQPRSLATPVTALPLQTDWPRMLDDLRQCGPMRLCVGNAVARLDSCGEARYLDCDRSHAALRGPDLTVAALTGRWASASLQRSQPDGPYRQIDIQDRQGMPLLRFALTAESRRIGFHALLVKRWARRSRPEPVADGRALPAQLQALQACVGSGMSGSLCDDWFERSDATLPGEPFDVSLLPPFLETLADQLLPLRVTVGNPGLLMRQDLTFYSLQQHDGQLSLRGDRPRLEIDLHRVTAGRIAGCRYSACRRCLRLYDRDGHCVCAFTVAPSASPVDRGLWQAMLRALGD